MKKFSAILSSLVLAALFDGCGLSPTPATPSALDTTLPIVHVNGHIQDMTSVAFEWKPIKDPRVVGINVYRSNPDSHTNTIQEYATISNRFATHYLDEGVKPNTQYRYFFTTFSKNAQGLASPTVTVTTPPVLQSVVWLQGISNMPRSAKIIWRPAENPIVKGYLIERETLDNPQWQQIAKLRGRLNSEYIDTSLADNKVYKYRIRLYTYNGLTSTPSQTVQITTKPLPNGVEDLNISTNLPKKIQLSWKQTTLKDFSYYKIYRSDNPDSGFQDYAHVTANHFTDHVNKDGAIYFYKVTIVDTDGLESITDIPAHQGITLPKPQAPAMVAASIVDGAAVIKWKDTDPRIQSFTLVKTTKFNWLDHKTQKIKNIKSDSYTDDNIFANIKYTYKVIAVDKYGIESLPSEDVEIISPNLPAYHKPQADNSVPETKNSGSVIKPDPNLNTNSL
jgi:uncharacterized protein